MPGYGRQEVWSLFHTLEKDYPQILFTKCRGIFNFHQRPDRKKFRIMCFLGRAVLSFALQCEQLLTRDLRHQPSRHPSQSVSLTCTLSPSRQAQCVK